MSKVTRLKIAFAAGILAMLANAVIPYQTFRWLSTVDRAGEHSEAIISTVTEVLAALKDAEAGQRGFVLTAREDFLPLYEEGLREARPALSRLESLLADRPVARRMFNDLQQQVESKILYMESSIALRRAQGLEAAARRVAGGEGKGLMDGIRATVREIVLTESARLAGLKEEERRRASISAYALALVAAVDLVVLGIVYFLVFRTIAERAAVENELREMGERLKSGMDALAVRNREMQVFHNMTEALQSASSTQESHGLIAKFAAQLFPDNPGTIYVFHASRDMLEAVGKWGAPANHRDLFEPDDCWALRRSQPHVMNDPARDLVCSHAAGEHRAALPYLCIPLNAHGETIGLISMDCAPGGAPAAGIGDGLREVAVNLAEQASLSLSNMRLREAMRHQSITDALTGLYNRRYLDETLRRELLRSARRSQPVAVIMLDADHFKRFNDTYGHDAGDLVLRALAGLMKEHARGSDVLCRYGGEEFVMIMPEMGMATAMERAAKLCEAARLLDVHYGGQHLGRVTISLGVAVAPDHADDAAGLLHAADTALYAAKQGGRDRVVGALASDSAFRPVTPPSGQ